MNDNNEKMLAKIRGLFQKAASVAGTPEADAFNAKAFELLAKYGLDEADLTPQEIRDDNKLVVHRYPLPEAFGPERMTLLFELAGALHCVGVGNRYERWVKVYGVARHARRVKLLYTFLSVQMATGVSTAVPADPFDKQGVKEHRVSWMNGFAYSVGRKVTEVEAAANRQRAMNQGDTSKAVAFQDDLMRAAKAAAKAHPHTRPAGGPSGHGTGFASGAAAGRAADVGQTRVGGAGTQRALG